MSENSGPTDLVVLKFGSSVLRDVADIPAVVSEIYRHVRIGTKVVAVVSAFDGATDALIEETQMFGADRDNLIAPRLISLGEAKTSALLAIAVDQAGISVDVADATDLGFQAEGHPRRALPTKIDVRALKEVLDTCDVVVVPGYVAISSSGAPVLLGRGGSDLTALFLAEQLGLKSVHLLKDVEGIFDQDPSKHEGESKWYSNISYSDAREIAGVLVQPAAIDFAKQHSITICVGLLGAGVYSEIASKTRAPALISKSRPLKVAMAGCGIVGTGVAKLIAGMPDAFSLEIVLVRDLRKPRSKEASHAKFVTSTDELIATAPDVIVDVLSSGDVGLLLTNVALENKIGVVSANKQALADDLPRLTRRKNNQEIPLEYSSSVGGGSPMIETVRRAALYTDVLEIDAIVNGTVNFILHELSLGNRFDEAIKKAQLAGFAEEDPTADLSGADAVAKAKILAWEAFGKTIGGEISCEALDPAKLAEIAGAPGVWRQLTKIRLDGNANPIAGISIVPIEKGDFFWDMPGERNAVRIALLGGKSMVAAGRGAGAVPTAHSIFADLNDIRRQYFS